MLRLALHLDPYLTYLDEEQVKRFVAAAELRTYEGLVDGVSRTGATPKKRLL